MSAKVKSAALMGIEGYPVEVEVDVERGVPKFTTVGLPDAAVKESQDRVKFAIKNSGFEFPKGRMTANLAPADVKKEGSAFDLPLAIGILLLTRQIRADELEKYILIGELSLEGELRPVRGALSITDMAKHAGYKGIILPVQNADEAAVVEGIEVYGAKNLDETVSFLQNGEPLVPHKIDLQSVFQSSSKYHLDFNDVKGQESAKRAIEVAAAGGHNVIMVGPPGSGKTMLAKRVPTILPHMSLQEAVETTKIHSVAGLIAPKTALVATRSYRSPHHTISDAGLIGGGAIPRPGEVSLAHNGVLFLDELPEFHRNVLEVLRQPLEDGVVTISRAAVSLQFPAQFMLVAAMNPCPCGNLTDPAKQCSCTPAQIQRYIGKISGPLLDRIDLHIEVPAVKVQELSTNRTGEPSDTIRERVNKARETQLHRFKGRKHLYCNAQMGSKDVQKYCELNPECLRLIEMATKKLGLSARAYDRVLKVSRTIADLAQSESIQPAHLSEAIQYRSLDRNLWK